MTKQKIFARSRPSVAYEIQVRRTLWKLLGDMQKDARNEIRRYKGYSLASDSSGLVEIMKLLRQRWYPAFEKLGKDVTKWLVERADKRTQKQLMFKLKQIGFAINPNYTPEQKEAIRLITEQSVSYIKSIPQNYLRNVQRVVARAMERGQDWEMITRYIDDGLKKVDVRVNNYASLIARDQMNKATQGLMIVNAQACGATKARWIHVSGKYSSRRTHTAMDGKVFSLADGLYDSDVKKNVKPGELIYCNCQMEILMPGFDD